MEPKETRDRCTDSEIRNLAAWAWMSQPAEAAVSPPAKGLRTVPVQNGRCTLGAGATCEGSVTEACAASDRGDLGQGPGSSPSERMRRGAGTHRACGKMTTSVTVS